MDTVVQLAQETYNTDLLLLLIQNIARFEFEARKDVVQIFNNLLRRQVGSRMPTVEYLASKPDIVFAALSGYENEEVALNTGMILREMLKHEPLAKILLYSDQYVMSLVWLAFPRSDIMPDSTPSLITSRQPHSASHAMLSPTSRRR